MRSRSLMVLVASLAVVGCGNSRTAPPNVRTPNAPGGFTPRVYSAFGFSLQTPRSWTVSSSTPPLVLLARSGSATIAVWRYPRTNPRLPRSSASLRHALGSLIAAVRARDPSFRLLHARVAPVAHRGGLEIVGLETVDGQLRTVRSTHFFVRRAEVVVDEYTPPNLFAAVDRATFVPVVHSLRAGRGV